MDAQDVRGGAGGSTSRPAVQRCVAIDTDVFAADVWSKTPLLSSGQELGSSYDDLFSLAAVDELLSRRSLRTPFIRLAKDGVVAPASRYTRSGGTGATVTDQVADDRVLELFLDGHTIVLQGLHRMWPPLIDFAGALATDLGHPVQINAYITPSSSCGFSAHYDVHDVFVLQVAGEKRWRIHEPVLRDPLRDEPWTDRRAEVAARAGERPLIETVLRPGDALYLPRGYLHAAEALGEVSCHLTIGVHPITRQHLVESLLAAVANDESLRASLPLGVDPSDPAAIAADLADVTTVLARRLHAVTADDVAARMGPRFVSGNRAAPVAPLAQAAAISRLDLTTVIAARRHLRPVLTTDGGRLELRVDGRTLALDVSAEKAVRTLLEGAELAVTDLPDLPPDEALDLALRLVRAAVAVVVDE